MSPNSAPRIALTLALAAAMAGCATDAPAPLRDAADTILMAPDLHAQAGSAAPIDIDLSRPLTPRALAVIAVIANPDLKAARAQARIADAQVIEAGLAPDPTFNLSFDKRLSGPDMFDGLGAQIVYELTALRDRGVTLAGARAARLQVRRDLAWREWQTAGQARLLAARIAGLERVGALMASARRSTGDALDRALAAAARGDVRADDVTARRLAAAEAADRARQCEGDLAAARGDLNALLGLSPEARLAIAPDAPTMTIADADALFARARVARLDLRALEAGYLSQEAVVRKAVWDAFPTLQLTISRTRDTANNQTLGPAVNFVLPLWNRNAGGIAVARATRERLRAEYAARLFATRAEIAALCRALALNRGRRNELAGQSTPIGDLAGRSDRAAAAGDVSRATAEASRQSALDKAIALEELDRSIAEQTVALELAVGAPLDIQPPSRTAS